MKVFSFRSFICLLLSIFLFPLTDLGFQTCHAWLNFSILFPKRKFRFNKIFNSDSVPVAGEFILRKRTVNGRPGEEMRFLVPLTAADTQFAFKACNPVRINNAIYSTKITPVGSDGSWRFDFEKIHHLPPQEKTFQKPNQLMNPIKKQIPEIKQAQNFSKKHSHCQKPALFPKTLLFPETFKGYPLQDHSRTSMSPIQKATIVAKSGFNPLIVPPPAPPSS